MKAADIAVPIVSQECIRLDVERLWLRAGLDPQLLQGVELSTIQDRVLDRLVMSLKAEIYSHKVAESSYTMAVPYPATPWQHFKHQYRTRWWMRRIVRRHPITFTRKEGRLTLSKAYRFPDSTVRYPDSFGRPIIIETGRLETEPWSGGDE